MFKLMKKQTNEGLSNIHKINEYDRIEKYIWYEKEPIKNPKNRKQIVKNNSIKRWTLDQKQLKRKLVNSKTMIKTHCRG